MTKNKVIKNANYIFANFYLQMWVVVDVERLQGF